MKKFLSILAICILGSSLICSNANADVAGLIPCKESSAFNKRLKSSVRKLEARLAKYDPGTPPALALEAQINKTKNRFDKYGKAGLLCGSDGLPHLISDGRWSRAGDFVFPGLLFLYITGWIGWVGRGYLQAVAKTSKPTEKEIILDVPLALKFSASGFTWPFAAWQEFTSGQLIEAEENITVSPR
uniref:Photosystem I reaction center subunit III n=1 Tax=Hommersandiophycus borowitzkae TaxID=268573 RepID=A0A1G4NTT5_9FLOR|nr:Photosystem I reaction center subunit III (plastocyanin-binding) [Hommersandiophycus borowitzkae]SCW22092.1 Photosystem I reaction center subunit III (plastocyanin-binding) [Hommersandiophycus borowitzkae]